MENEHGIEIEVRGQIKGGYRLKVTLHSIGIYIDGFRATESAQDRLGYWIQPPSQKVNGVWKVPIEFDKHTEFWLELEQMCVDAINDYMPETQDKVYEPSDKEISEPINLEDINLDEIFGKDESPTPKAVSWLDPKDRRK